VSTGGEQGRGYGGFFTTLVSRPVTLLVIFAALVVVGLISYARIPIQMMPEGIVEPALQIWARNPGASAQENEEKVTRVLEEQLRTLTGIERIDSGSGDDSVWVQVSFDAGQDMDVARAEVRDRIERARPLLPDTVEDVGMWSWRNDQLPIVFFALLHPGDSKQTDFLVDNVIRRRLEAVDGVGRVEVWGVLDDSMRILLDEDRVRAANLDLGALIRRLSADNFAEPLGEVTDGGRRVLLRSDMRFTSPDQIEAYPIGDGLTLADVARVVEVKSVRNRLFKIDGRYAYYGEVQKDSQANVVATSRRLSAAFEDLKADPRLAGEFEFLPLFDQGRFIESSLAQLEQTALWGGGLAVVVLLVFLRRVRLTLAVALSIPVSALLAIAWTYFSGGTFNVLTMTGVTLAIGMLVDNAVVVIENISRLRAEGHGRLAAASAGARDVALAVLLATLTTVVVFLPLIFMSENPLLRIMFGELGLPLCLSLLFSLLVALVFLPVIAARLVGPRPAPAQRLAAALAPAARLPARAVARVVGALRGLLHTALRGAFAAERAVLALATPLRWPLALGLVGLAAWRVARALPALQLGQRQPDFGAARGAAPAAAAALMLYGLPAVLGALVLLVGLPRWRRRAARPPAPPARLVPAGDSILGLVGDGVQRVTRWSQDHRLAATGLACLALLSVLVPSGRMNVTSFGQDENTGRLDFYVRLDDDFTLAEAEAEMRPYEAYLEERRERWGFAHLADRFDETGGRFSLYWEGANPKENYDAVVEQLREGLVAQPGHTLIIGDEAASERNRNVVAFRLTGPESERLEALGREAIALLEQVPGLSSITSPLENAPQQVRVQLDADLTQRFGISAQTALQNIAWALRGWQLPRYQEPGREIPLLIEYDDEEVAGLGTLRDLEVRGQDAPVPLSAFAELEFGKGSRTIRRRDGQTSFMITARVDDPLRQKELSDAGYAALRSLELPRGYAIGEDDLVSTRQQEEFAELRAALMLSVVLVFLLMGILFESFLLPFSVLFTIPFAVVGALWTLYVTGTTMDSVGWIGIIILVGVVVNNGIVLIDRIHTLRSEGVARGRAVIKGTAQRVRPILMTALTTIFGLVPMTLAEPPSDGIDYRALATCVAGGLACSTFFTLWVVPLAYTQLDDLRHALRERARWALRPTARAARAAPQA
jgi:HAE1 family hydrophobic/amphiphilic exporter-1